MKAKLSISEDFMTYANQLNISKSILERLVDKVWINKGVRRWNL